MKRFSISINNIKHERHFTNYWKAWDFVFDKVTTEAIKVSISCG